MSIGDEIERIKATSRQGFQNAEIYVPILEALGLGEKAVAIASGDLKVPGVDKPIGRIFPPALIPLWSTPAGSIVGCWKHWFVEQRPKFTFVEHYGETIFGIRNITKEIGRTLDQAIYEVIIDRIFERESADSELREFAARAGIQDLDEIEAGLNRDGDFSCHPAFKDNLPLNYFESTGSDPANYLGDFPHPRMHLSAISLSNACEFEVHSGFKGNESDYEFRHKVKQFPGSPPWFTEENKSDLFETYLKQGELGHAWMTLNSVGWSVDEVRHGLSCLADKADDDRFAILAETWNCLPFDKGKHY